MSGITQGWSNWHGDVWDDDPDPLEEEVPQVCITLEEAMEILLMACAKRHDGKYAKTRYREAFLESYYEFQGEQEGIDALKFPRETHDEPEQGAQG